MNEIAIASEVWVKHHQALKEQGFVRLEYVTAVHLGGEVFKFVSLVSKQDLSEQTLSSTQGAIATLREVFQLADFHEREIIQMFGAEITGHPSDAKAFDVEFEGHPLRRDFALTQRVGRQWPGAVEPDASAKRRPALAPGVLGDWQS